MKPTFFVLMLLGLTRFSQAGLVSSKLAAHLESQADSIIVGSIISSRSSSNGALIQVKVIRSIKGPVAPRLVLDVTVTEKTTMGGPPPSGGGPAAIWFVTQSSPGNYLLLPARTGDVDLQHMGLFVNDSAPTALYAYETSEPVLDKLAKETGAFAEKQQCVESEDAIVQSLQGIDSAAMLSMLRRYAASNVPWLRGIGIASLIQRGDPASLQQLQKDLTGVLADPAFGRSGPMLDILAAIELMYRSTDSAGIQALGALATSPGSIPRLTSAASYALRSIHSKETLPYLARLLDHADISVRYHAMYGIAAFANGLPITTPDGIANMSALKPSPQAPFADANTRANVPGYPTYRENEAQYRSFWKQWWRAHQTETGN